MASLNRITLIGTVDGNVEARVTNSGDQFSRFTLVVSRPERSDGMESGVDRIEVVAWRDMSDAAGQLAAGSLALVEGKIITRTTEDENGKRQYFTEVDAREVKALSGAAPTASAPVAEAPAVDTAALDQMSGLENVAVESKNVEEVRESDFDFGGSTDTESNDSFEKELEEEVPF